MSNSYFSHCVFKRLVLQTHKNQKTRACLGKGELTFSQTTNFRLFLTEGLQIGNFKFDENVSQLSRQVENTAGKVKTSFVEQFLFYPQCFQKTCTADM